MRSIALVVSVCALVAALPAAGQVPGEIQELRFDGPSTLGWQALGSAQAYQVYRGTLDGLRSGTPARCHGFDLQFPAFGSPGVPQTDDGFFYIVTAVLGADHEGPAGQDSSGEPRQLLGSCAGTMRSHVLDRLGFGWGEWSAQRIEQLGLDGYVAEQLDPDSIDEETNIELRNRLFGIDPPQNITQLLQQQVVRAVHSRRQLEQQYAAFWANHFNTFWIKVALHFRELFPTCESPGNPPQCDPSFPTRAWLETSMFQYREIERFRDLGFNGTFRQMVEASALSPAMIIYLDSVSSVVGAPNENYPRELLELHTMGVDNGYTQADIQELARALTGFSVCKKSRSDFLNPLAACLEPYWDDGVSGEFTAHFDPAAHDCTQKVLFAGTPHEVTLPDTCATPIDGFQDLEVALDAIVEHPSTAEFISRKILEKFVTEQPDEALVEALVAEWNDVSNPQGVGDLRAVLSAALGSSTFGDPDFARTKIKTPLEHFTSTIRATRGRTNGSLEIINYLNSTQHMPHYNSVPTGWPEDGASWINTNGTLDRQNFAYALLTSSDPDFAAEPIHLLTDHGISTAPGNAAAIVDFFSDILFGGALTPAEHQRAIDFLNSDDGGNPSAYGETRIREAIALMLGYPQFQEQ